MSDFPTGTRHPGGPFWAAMSQEPQKPGAAFPHTRRIIALEVKGPKTLKPPPTLPKPCLPPSCRESSLKSTKGVGGLLLGTLLPPHHQNRALALLFLHFRRRVRKEKLCAEQGRDACLEMPKLGNKSGHVGFLSSGGSPQNLMACPGQVRRPQGVPRSPCKARVVRVDVEEKSPGSEIGRFGTGMKGGGKKGRLRRPGRPRRWAHVFNRSRGQQGLARKAMEMGGRLRTPCSVRP